MENRNERQPGAMENTGDTLGGMAGKMAGRAADAAMDVASSVASSAFQILGGWWSGSDADQVASSFSDNEAACRRHHQTATTSSTTTSGSVDFERTRPVYEFGYVARHNPDYSGRPFDEVEAELEQAWERVGQNRYGDWPEVQDRVRFGYDGL